MQRKKIVKTNITNALRLNPQIRSLKIRGSNAEFVKSISKHLQFIEVLHVFWCPEQFNFDGTIDLRNVKHFKVNMYDNYSYQEGDEEYDLFPKIPFSFSQLEELTLNLDKSHIDLSDDFMNFISSQSSLTKLTVEYDDDMQSPFGYYAEKLKLAQATRSLKEINLKPGDFTIYEILHFVRICDSVKKFSFGVENSSMADQLSKRLSSEWCISHKRNMIKMQR